MRMTFYTRRTASAGEAGYWAHYWDGHWTAERFRAASVPEYDLLHRYVPPPKRILDAGCGKGFLLRILVSEGYRARGMDFDQASVLGSVREMGLMPAEVADLNHLPYRSKSFEGVLLAGTIEHIPTGPERGFREVNRVLEPGGLLVLTIPYVNLLRKLYSPLYLLWETLGGPKMQDMHFHQFAFSRFELDRILSGSGLEIVHWERAYYTTTLYKFPGLARLRETIFSGGASKGGNAPGPRPSGAAAQHDAGARPQQDAGARPLKRAIEGALNLLMANRLLVVARKVRELPEQNGS